MCLKVSPTSSETRSVASETDTNAQGHAENEVVRAWAMMQALNYGFDGEKESRAQPEVKLVFKFGLGACSMLQSVPLAETVVNLRFNLNSYLVPSRLHS